MSAGILFKDGDVYINLPFLITSLAETIDFGYENLVTSHPEVAKSTTDVLIGMETVLNSLKTFNELGRGIDN